MRGSSIRLSGACRFAFAAAGFGAGLTATPFAAAQSYQLYEIGNTNWLETSSSIDATGNVVAGSDLHLLNTSSGNVFYNSQDVTTVGSWPPVSFTEGRTDTRVLGISRQGTAAQFAPNYFGTHKLHHQTGANTTGTDTVGWVAGNFGAGNARVGYRKVDPGYYGGMEQATVSDPYNPGQTTTVYFYNGSEIDLRGMNSPGQAVGREVHNTFFYDLQNNPIPIQYSKSFIYNAVDDTYQSIPHPQLLQYGDHNVVSTANSINDSGLVTGSAGLRHSTQQAYIYNSATNQYLTLASPSGGSAEGLDINNKGHVAGYFYNGSQQRAMLYTGGSVADLVFGSSYFSSAANALNDAGMVVGYALQDRNGDPFAALFSGGQAINLNTFTGQSDLFLTEAIDVNDAGWIVARGYRTYLDHNNVTRRTDSSVFVLNPSAALTPGGSEITARLPDTTQSGSFGFSSAPSGQWFDPPMASGFRYAMNGDENEVDDGNGGTTTVTTYDTLFTQITLPSGYQDMLIYVGEGDDRVLINALDAQNGDAPIGLDGGETVLFSDFSSILGDWLLTDGSVLGVAVFSIESIDPRANIENPLAFPLQIWFSNDEYGDFEMTALDVIDVPDNYIPEPAALSLVGLATLALARRRRA
jgi:hypothetical protein